MKRSILLGMGLLFAGTPQTFAQTADGAPPLPTIMVLPRTEENGPTPLAVLQSNEYAKQTHAAITSFLTSQEYRVTDLAQLSQVSKQVGLVSSVRNHADDPLKLAAQAIGADVYIGFEGKVTSTEKGSQTVLILSAFETTTARLLGTTTSPGANSTSGGLSAIDAAARDSIGRLMEKVKAYWKTDNSKGLQYKVEIRYKGIDDELRMALSDSITNAIEDNFPIREELTSTPTSAEYLVWAPREKFGSSNRVSQVFRGKLNRRDVKVIEVYKNRKLVILEISPK